MHTRFENDEAPTFFFYENSFDWKEKNETEYEFD